MSVHASGQGWNDPPPQALGDSMRKPSTENPYRRKIDSCHRRSHSSGFSGDVANPIGSSPLTRPSILLPSSTTHYPSDPNSPALVRNIHGLVSNSQYPQSYTSSSDSLDGLAPHPDMASTSNHYQLGPGGAVTYQNQISCPTYTQPTFLTPSDNSQTDLAHALNDRLLNLTLRNSPDQLRLHSPMSSPGTFSPARRSRSPVSLSVIDNIEPNFDIDGLLEKVEYLRISFRNNSNTVQYADKLDAKLQTFVSSWSSLNSTLRNLIHKLVFCILTNQTDLATKCFVKMSVEYSSDVMSWSMAFKRLISHFESNPAVLS